LQKDRFKYDLRKFCFSNRIIDIWNSLPDFFVSGNTTNIFKDRLDKFWVNQDILYDFKAQLHRTEIELSLIDPSLIGAGQFLRSTKCFVNNKH